MPVTGTINWNFRHYGHGAVTNGTSLQMYATTLQVFLPQSCVVFLGVSRSVDAEQLADGGYCCHPDVLQKCWGLSFLILGQLFGLGLTQVTSSYFCGVWWLQQLIGDLSGCCHIFRRQLFGIRGQDLSGGCEHLQVSRAGELWDKRWLRLFYALYNQFFSKSLPKLKNPQLLNVRGKRPGVDVKAFSEKQKLKPNKLKSKHPHPHWYG